MLASTAVAVSSGPASGTDIDNLQGVWTSVAGRRQVKLLIAGHRFTFEILDGDIYMGNIRLDWTSEPKQMDMRIDEGPLKHKGEIALCIYEFENELLRWCPTRPGTPFRLSSFPSIDDERYLSLVFKRERLHRSR